MHRIYTKEEYLNKDLQLREIVPHAAIGTDIIVGFPSETEEEFMETYQVFEQVKYSVAFIFTYSPRQGTPAMRWKDDIPEEVKTERHHRLMDLHKSQIAEQHAAFLNEPTEVLVEKRNRNGQLKGRTRCWKKVIFDGPDEWIGTLRQVKLHSFNHETLVGKSVEL
jgi:tRNA-2-methylthio-N6-dimethylallyladenosine synthase